MILCFHFIHMIFFHVSIQRLDANDCENTSFVQSETLTIVLHNENHSMYEIKKILRAILDPWDPWGLCTQPRLTWFVACFRCRRNISNMRLPFNFWLPYRSKTIVIWHIRNEKGCRDLPSKRYCLRRSRASSVVEQGLVIELSSDLELYHFN